MRALRAATMAATLLDVTMTAIAATLLVFQRRSAATMVAHGNAAILNGPNPAVGSRDPVLDVEPAGHELVRDGINDAPAVIRVNRVGPVEARIMHHGHGCPVNPAV